MKKIVVLMLLLCVGSFIFAGGSKESPSNDSDKLQVVATTFPIYDWLLNIIGEDNDNVELTLLNETAVDLHSYQPSIAEVAKISTSDMFVYVGGHSEGWAGDVAVEAKNKDLVALSLFDILGDDVKSEAPVNTVGGGEHEHDDCCEHEDHDHEHDDCCEHEDHDHDHDHDDCCEHEDHDHDHDHDDDCEVEGHVHNHDDEHVWLSIKNAETIVEELTQELCFLDAENAAMYKANGAAYEEKLDALDEKFEEAVENANNPTVLVADRFPFLYLVDDYDINYFAAFNGCSAETEASFETIAFLSQKIDELGIKNILQIEGRVHEIPRTVVENTKTKDQNVLILDSLQSTSLDEIKAGKTYLSVMEGNLDVLKKVFKN